MNGNRKKIIALFASLVILLAQFGVVLHAVEHPFHAEESQCLTFKSAKQDNSLLQNESIALVSNIINSDIVTLSIRTAVLSFNSQYLSRAPPYFTI